MPGRSSQKSETNSTGPAPIDSARIEKGTPAFQKALHKWYRKHHRKLPWREEPSLYRTVVSEMMLQQTRIETALPYFARWMAALPDFESLAAASEEEVLRLWEGLGYYRRARNLHRLAGELVNLDEIPESAEDWKKFSGIGPYSAAAITSIAFNTPAACVDGNVVRVLARLTGDKHPLKDSTSAAKIFHPLAQRLLDSSNPGLHNQAMMEIGATVCQRKPECARCPLTRFCEAYRLGIAEEIPAFAPRQTEKVEVVRIWAERDGFLLLARAASHAQRLAQLYELPSCEQLGLPPATVRETGTFKLKKKRSITRFAITEQIYEMDEEVISPANDELSWVALEELEKIALSGPHRRWVSMILAGTQQ